jgi:uncharacterized membrane protein
VSTPSPSPNAAPRPIGTAITLVATAALGLLASLALTLDKFALLENPQAALNCNINPLVGCSVGLTSELGSVFGFPNPILGLMFWSAIGSIGVGLLAGARFAGWFWMLVSLASAAALALVIWFIVQSIYVLGVLCPWCVLTWVVTIPLFFVVVLHTCRSEWAPAPLRRVAAAAFPWIPLASVLAYLVVAVLAQLRLDLLALLF